MTWLSKTFLKGLIALLPLAVTVTVLYWLGAAAESLLGGLMSALLPQGVYRPGMGLAAGFILVFIAGTLLNLWVLNALFERWEWILTHVPLVKTLYNGTRDLLGYFSKRGKKPPEQAVLVSMGGGARVMGLVTRDDFSELPGGLWSGGMVAVYCPLSYALGGITLLVPRSAVEHVPLTVEEAMRFAMTAGMSVKHEEGKGIPPEAEAI
jgi:uncharacterized membrane protein